MPRRQGGSEANYLENRSEFAGSGVIQTKNWRARAICTGPPDLRDGDISFRRRPIRAWQELRRECRRGLRRCPRSHTPRQPAFPLRSRVP